MEKEHTCPCCEESVPVIADMVTCRNCQATYHRECWERHGGCTTSECADSDAAAVTPSASHSVTGAGALAAPPARSPLMTLLLSIGIPALILLLTIFAIKPGADLGRWVLVLVVVTALGFDFVNGMNDSANAIATVVSTRVLTPIAALIMASLLNLFGALAHTGVAKFISGEIFVADQITILMILCGLLGAVGWSWFMTMFGMPISLSHSLIGGLIGAALFGGAAVKTAGIMKILLWMVLAPVIGFVAGLLLMISLMWVFQRVAPHKINRHFRIWQIVSSAMVAFSHGGNDAQKAMGVITLALVTAQVQSDSEVSIYVKLSCAAVIALGTGIGGWRVIKTLGHKMIKLAPIHGFAAETAAAGAIQLATMLHAPVSTTHVISTAIMGVGSSKRLSAVRWGVAGNILTAWIFTIPTCGIVAALLYALVRWVGLK